MNEIREIVEVIDKLTELTQNEHISWVKEEPGNLMTSENNIDFIYLAEYQEDKIRLYLEEYKFYIDEDDGYWKSHIIIELIDGDGNALWRFPETGNSWDLLNAIKYKDARVGDFLKRIRSA